VVPDRAIHGYGLTPAIVDLALQHRPDLLVTVDNGVSAREALERAQSLGVEVLLTDHHSLPEVMPPPLRRENTFAQIANAAGGLGSALWNFLTLIIALSPKLGARFVNILAMVAMVFVALYLFLSRGFGDYLVRATQMAVIGFIFPNSSAVVMKEF
jgi:hypothetical protein